MVYDGFFTVKYNENDALKNDAITNAVAIAGMPLMQ
jgi:hypothetical protein